MPDKKLIIGLVIAIIILALALVFSPDEDGGFTPPEDEQEELQEIDL